RCKCFFAIKIFLRINACQKHYILCICRGPKSSREREERLAFAPSRSWLRLEKQKSMPIHIIVAETEPLLSEGLARALCNDPHLAASAGVGTPREILEQCSRSQPCVLLAAEPLLERINPGHLRQQLDYGRALSVLVLGPASEPERVAAWLRLGCMGYLARSDTLDTLKRALYAVNEGQLWARRSDLALLLRQLLAVTQTGPRFTP